MGDIIEMQQEEFLCPQCGGDIGYQVDFPRECKECEEPEQKRRTEWDDLETFENAKVEKE